MKTYIVEATVLDEVCIADRQGAGNEYIGLDYIPGTTWWGALAALAGLHPGQPPQDEWVRLVFYSGEVVFGNLYPVGEGVLRAHPVPLSARTRKEAPGFKHPGAAPVFRDFDDKKLDPSGVVDLLYSQDQHYEPDYEPIGGWYVDNPPQCRSLSVSMMLRGHNDRAGRSGTTREGRLFFRQNIPHDVRFQGALRAITPQGAQALSELLHHLDNTPLEIPVGRQPGSVCIDWRDLGQHDAPWQERPVMREDSLLTVTLLSDALLVDRYLRPLTYLPPEELKAGLSLTRADMINGYSATRDVSGWNGAYGRPREVELAVRAGSAFLYRVEWPQEVTADERVNRLTVWQRRGVGLRTAEGFGELRVSDPFHREYQEVLS